MSRSLVTSQPPALAPPLLSISPTGLSQLSPLQALAPAAVPPRSDSLHASTSTLNPSPHTAPTQFNPPTPYPSFPNSVYPALATLTLDDTSHAPSASTETLPRYSRRAATSASAEDDPPLKEFALQSKSRKMSLRFMAAGEANPVLVQPEPDARTWLKGSLVLTLPSSEPVAYIKIRLKGVVRTMVMKVSIHTSESGRKGRAFDGWRLLCQAVWSTDAEWRSFGLTERAAPSGPRLGQASGHRRSHNMVRPSPPHHTRIAVGADQSPFS